MTRLHPEGWRSAWLREPLLHFVLIGAGLFLAYGLTSDAGSQHPRVIRVDRGRIEQLEAQFRRVRMRPPTPTERADLIESFVREEVLYREALRMGLDQDDPVVKQRMRLKLEFLIEDVGASEPPDDAALDAFRGEHPDRYREPARISFQQVFLSDEGRADGEHDARSLLARLAAGDAPSDPGDPTMLPETLEHATERDIAASFGDEFASSVAALETDAWHGPLRSAYGLHLVRISRRIPARSLPLDEVRAEVERDWRAQQRDASRDRVYRRLRERYEVEVESGPPSGPTEASSAASGGAGR